MNFYLYIILTITLALSSFTLGWIPLILSLVFYGLSIHSFILEEIF